MLWIALALGDTAVADTTHRALKRVSSGVVSPTRTVTVSAKIIGRVKTITGDEGQTVKAGATLLVMDDAELQAELASAKASQGLAKVELAHKQRVVVRLQRLFKSKAISDDRFDDAQFEQAVTREKVKVTEAKVARAQAMLSETRLLAPFDALIAAKHVEVGQLTEPGEPLFVLEDHSELKFRTKVKEQDIPHIEVGQIVYVTIDALDGLRLEGTVTKIVPSGSADHTFLVEARLPDRDKLFPGMFGKAEFGP